MRELNLWIDIVPNGRHCECFIDIRTLSKITNHDLSSDNKTFFNFLKQFPLKNCSNECWKLLEIYKRELNLLGSQAQNLQHDNF